MKSFLFNPFIKIAGSKAFILGLLFILVSSILATLFNTRFDGVIDLHFYNEVHWVQPLLDQLIGLISMVVVFYMIALILRSKPRLIDLVGTFAYCRMAFLLAPFLNMSGFVSGIGNQLKAMDPNHPVLPFSSSELVILILIILFSLALVVWLVTLYFKAWKTCSNLKGNQLVISFIAGLLIVEILMVYLTRNLTA